ncbi:MAG: hypothetical protein OXI80_05850, partial [Caldilineaceae bacterium]|nr:hypothetical protein [Caldilineaceae bacterium]
MILQPLWARRPSILSLAMLALASKLVDSIANSTPRQGVWESRNLGPAGRAKPRYGYNDSGDKPVTRLVVMVGLVAAGANG